MRRDVIPPQWEKHDDVSLAGRIAAWHSAEPLTFVYSREGVEVPCRLSIRPGADRLLILFNGAVDRQRSRSGIVFQRSSWREEFDAHCLWVADPTITHSIQMRIGWGQLNGVDFLPCTAAPLVKAVAHALGCEPARRRLYYGSSAGGFQALATAALDEGAAVMVNNPQTDWLKCPFLRDVELVTRLALRRSSAEQVREEFPWRSDLRALFELCEHAPRVEYHVNFSSKFDVEDHYRPLREWYEADDARAERFVSRSYRDGSRGVSAHAPLPREQTVSALHRNLASLT